MKLDELLKKITPLPWEIYGPHIYRGGKDPKGANVASVGCLRAKTEVGYTVLRCTDPDIREAYRNAEYLHHAANALPELVEAVRVTLKENAHLADGDVCTLKSLKDALARATEVKL
jgi:hypothetical protein